MRKFEAIRTEIKKLSDSQKVLKPQIKTSYEGIRTTRFPLSERTKNKYELRHLFQAYAILKGIERPEVKKPSKYNGWVLDHKKILEMVEEYRPVEVQDEVNE